MITRSYNLSANPLTSVTSLHRGDEASNRAESPLSAGQNPMVDELTKLYGIPRKPRWRSGNHVSGVPTRSKISSFFRPSAQKTAATKAEKLSEPPGGCSQRCPAATNDQTIAPTGTPWCLANLASFSSLQLPQDAIPIHQRTSHAKQRNRKRHARPQDFYSETQKVPKCSGTCNQMNQSPKL